MEYLQIAEQIANILVGFSLIILVLQFSKDTKGQNFQALFYLHQYLAQDEFGYARYMVRKELSEKDYSEWSVENKKYANEVCASYDQAGILISFGIMSAKTKRKFLKSSWGISICEQYDILNDYLNDKQTPLQTGREFFHHFTDLYKQAHFYHKKTNMQTVAKIVSGGQTGVDRAALDFALINRINYGGWCPKGGLSEDYPTPPGLLEKYIYLTETKTNKVSERTKMNVRDSDATLIIIDNNGSQLSAGTELTIQTAKELNKPYLVLNIDDRYCNNNFRSFLLKLKNNNTLNIAGPRASENPELYSKVFSLLNQNINFFIKK